MVFVVDDDDYDGDDVVAAGEPGGVVEAAEVGGVRPLSGISGLQHSPGGRHHQY